MKENTFVNCYIKVRSSTKLTLRINRNLLKYVLGKIRDMFIDEIS